MSRLKCLCWLVLMLCIHVETLIVIKPDGSLHFIFRYREIKKRVRDNESLTTNVPRINNPSRRSLQAGTWLDKYIRNFGERQPDREEVHLPKCLSKETVYGISVKEMERSKEPILSISGFRDFWLKNFSHVKICTVSIKLFVWIMSLSTCKLAFS